MRRNHIHHGRDVGIFTFDNGLVSTVDQMNRFALKSGCFAKDFLVCVSLVAKCGVEFRYCAVSSK